MVLFSTSKKNFIFVLLDFILLCLAFYFSYWLRYNGNIPTSEWIIFKKYVFIITIIEILGLLILRLYTHYWKYFDLYEMLSIAVALGVSGILISFSFLLQKNIVFLLPRSVLILNFLISFVLIVGYRFFLKKIWGKTNKIFINKKQKLKKILIYGAGEAGVMLLKESQKYPDLKLQIIGFLDDDKKKWGMRINNLKIFGDLTVFPSLYEKYKFSEFLIAIPSASKKRIKQIVNFVSDYNKEMKIKIVPGTREIINGEVKWEQIKKVTIEDLLGRTPIMIDDSSISQYLSGKKILITGAGGSIGSELVRQILKYKPQQVKLLGRGENSIYELLSELTLKKINLSNISTSITNIANLSSLENVFKTFKPEIVFHAAAHKHVPLMEENVHEAFLNNVIGSLNVFDMSVKYNSQKIVSISTDKAVNPTSVMGATKRIVEIILQIYAKLYPKTGFSAVRFGNVLGSRGSVIPFFKKQIEQGGPITVTDKKMVRFFMTIPEAVSLVLQSGTLGKNGEIFVLDMGEPVKIYDLAVNLIKLSGLKLDEDISIKITGLRPGEKLYEEILTEAEGISATKYEKIFVAKPEKYEMSKIDDVKDIYQNLYNLSSSELKQQIFEFIN